MTKRYHVYGVGAALVDTEINLTDDDLKKMEVEKGMMTLVDEKQRKQLLDKLGDRLKDCKQTSGGSTANTLIAISQFGGKTFYSCKVGNDDNGHFYLHELKSSGVDYDKDKCYEEGYSGTCLVMITPDAERTLCSYLGVNSIQSKDDLSPEIIAISDYVYFEAYMFMSPKTSVAANRIREIAEEHNVKTALSFSDPGIVVKHRESLAKLLNKPVDLLFCNRKEALNWAQTDNIESSIDSLKKIAHTFAITLGAEGALVYDGTKQYKVAPCKVKPVNTNGAGDMFAGAFLYAITQGKDFPTAANLASLAAATVVSDDGARLTADKQKQLLQQWITNN